MENDYFRSNNTSRSPYREDPTAFETDFVVDPNERPGWSDNRRQRATTNKRYDSRTSQNFSLAEGSKTFNIAAMLLISLISSVLTVAGVLVLGKPGESAAMVNIQQQQELIKGQLTAIEQRLDAIESNCGNKASAAHRR